ncbi:MAG: hypothetical protein Q4F95_16030 [Oscillospiraceae bacterium]|nr:hypothetical protein [Oscillospiraceae bacterium]
MEKNVIVTDRSGKVVGLTYPKRAKGLIKNSRAVYISSNEIRLQYDAAVSCVNNYTEDDNMSELDTNKNEEKYTIYFNARDWSVCTDVGTNKNPSASERVFVTDFEGNLSESFSISAAQNAAEIGTKQLVLKKHTSYMFYFWIKMDKNIKLESSCQLNIIYNNDFENKRVYILSNKNIKPLKATQGWKLYGIPFTTEDNEYTQLRFVIRSAQCSIIPGKEAECYSGISDEEYSYDDYDTAQNKKIFDSIPNSFKDFFSQFDKKNNTSASDSTKKDDPFKAFNDFAKQMKKDIQRDINKSVRSDIYQDIKSMKDDIVNEIKNTFNNGNSDQK